MGCALSLVSLDERGRRPGYGPEGLRHLRLVDREGEGHVAGQGFRGRGAIARKQRRRIRVQPAAGFGEPAGRRHVHEGDRRVHAVFAAARDHAFVVVELGDGELPAARLDPRPFERESIGVEAQPGEQRDVLLVSVIAVAGVARSLGEGGRLDVLEKPQV